MISMKELRELGRELFLRMEDGLHASLRITLSGGREALVENHRGVMEYTPERIVAAGRRGKLTVLGTGLSMTAMNGDELLIEGKIQGVEWE